MSSAQERPGSVGQAGQTRGAYGSGYEQAAGYPAGQAAPAPEMQDLSAGVMAGRVLAGFLMIISGALNFLWGLAAIIHGSFFVSTSNYAYHWSVRGWGWFTLIAGCVLFAVGVCVLLGMMWARIAGIALVSLAAISNFLLIPLYPVWSIVLIAVDIFVIWALASSGRSRDYA